MTPPHPLARLLKNQIGDDSPQDTGQLVQRLILFFSTLAALSSVAHALLFSPSPRFSLLIPELGLILLPTAGAWWLLRRGQPRTAARLYFLCLIVLFLGWFIWQGSPISLFYLLLLPVVGFAFVERTRSVLLAGGLLVTLVAGYQVVAGQFALAEVGLYGITAVALLTLIVWLIAAIRQQNSAAIHVAQELYEAQARLSLSSSLATTLDVGEIYRRSARLIAGQLDASVCVISQWVAESESLVTQIRYTRVENGRFTEQYDFTTQSEQRPLPDNVPLIRHLDDAESPPAEVERLRQVGQASSLEVLLRRDTINEGTVQLFRNADQPTFSPAEAELAQMLALETAVALHNARLTAEAQGQVAQLSALNRLSNSLSLAATLRQIFDNARREIFSLFEATAMSVVLVTPDGRHLDWVYAYEYGQEIDLSSIPLMDITQGFSGQVARQRRHLLVNQRFRELATEYQSITIGALASTWLGFPLIVANNLIGVLAIENEHNPDAFGERDVQLLETIAGALAIAINNLLQLEAIQSALAAQSVQRNQLQTAAEVAAAATSILELDALLERAVNLIRERFSLYYAGLFLLDKETNMAVLHAGTGEAGRIQLERGHQLAVGSRSLIGGATEDGQPRISQDVTQDEEWQPNPHLPATRSELAIPLRVRGQIIGALTVQSTEANAFSPELISTLQTMGDQLAIAIDNARLLADAEGRARRQRELNEISAQLRRTADTEAILRIGLQAISERLEGRPVGLSLGIRAEQSTGERG
jgi:GAF domain-containing protein